MSLVAEQEVDRPQALDKLKWFSVAVVPTIVAIAGVGQVLDCVSLIMQGGECLSVTDPGILVFLFVVAALPGVAVSFVLVEWLIPRLRSENRRDRRRAINLLIILALLAAFTSGVVIPYVLFAVGGGGGPG